MNESRIKALRQRRYSEVNESQKERNQERVSHVADLLSELEGRIENDTGRLETAKELLSVAGSETRTEGCNVVLTDCLKLLKECAEDAGLAQYYREQMREMPDETVSESPSVEADHIHERGYSKQKREYAWTESEHKERLANRGE
jgi:hypothetical protein